MDLSSVDALVPADRSSPDRWRDGDAWLAGGTWLFSEPQPTVRRLLDLTAFGWPALVSNEAGLEIAATCTLAQLAAWPGRADWPASLLLAQCCNALLGSFKVWNAATVGGNLCVALPAGPMVSLCASLDGVCTIWEPRERVGTVAAVDFVLAPSRSVLAPGALLRSVSLPARALRSHTAFRHLSLSPVGRSAVVVIGRRGLDDGEAVITITAAVRRPVQLRFDAVPGAEELRAAIDERELDYHEDVHGHPRWREHLTRLFAEEVREELGRSIG